MMVESSMEHQIVMYIGIDICNIDQMYIDIIYYINNNV